MKGHVLGVVAATLLALPLGRADAAFIRSGFNDVSGINGDGVANNSPFNVANAPLGGQGVGEPGWAGPWFVSVGSVAVGGTAFEGDGAAAFFQNTAAADRVLAQAPTQRFRVDYRILVPRSISRDVVFRVYDNTRSNIFDAIAAQLAVLSDFQFNVIDGIEDSCQTGLCHVEATGLFLTPGVWNEIGVEVDPVGRTWDLFVNGVHYNAPDPLGFRGVPVLPNAIQFLNEIGAPDGSFVDAVTVNLDLTATAVPEPSSCALAATGLLVLVARRVRRRRGGSEAQAL